MPSLPCLRDLRFDRESEQSSLPPSSQLSIDQPCMAGLPLMNTLPTLHHSFPSLPSTSLTHTPIHFEYTSSPPSPPPSSSSHHTQIEKTST
ncbi:hypothetical protein DL98DRAFT_517642 [Cadophora sp. DSE1049]|nr:hypothetical protein DL98DRAFT_517642 [Cadophora sp. DSE1049]